MATTFTRITKITNAAGRSGYIKDSDKQEEIVITGGSMEYTWEEHAEFEKSKQHINKKNNEAREIIAALPHSLYGTEDLKSVCDELCKRAFPENHDHEYAVHWNKKRTNLHVHIIFSERPNMKEKEPKRYARDMWYDKDTNKMTKANTENSELRYRKGEIQKDKEGNIKYKDAVFGSKDTMFYSKAYTNKRLPEIMKEVLHEHGIEVELRTKDDPYLSQRKLYKGASEDYIEKATKWNEEVKKYNQVVREHINLDPEKELEYVEIKKELQYDVREFNREEGKITDKGINLISSMIIWILGLIKSLKEKEFYNVGYSIDEYWGETKNQFNELFQEVEKIEQEEKLIKNDNELLGEIEEMVEGYQQDKEQVKEEVEVVEITNDYETNSKTKPIQETKSKIANWREDDYER